jgi:hypothetical protein
MVGMVLTFNMGRDITLLVLYPFVFGYLILIWRDRQRKGMSDAAIPARSPHSSRRQRYFH